MCTCDHFFSVSFFFSVGFFGSNKFTWLCVNLSHKFDTYKIIISLAAFFVNVKSDNNDLKFLCVQRKPNQKKILTCLERQRDREREGHAAAAVSPTLLFLLEACFSFVLACVKEWWDFGGLKKLRIIFHKRDDEIWGDANTWWRILSFVQVDLCDHDALEDVFNTFRYAAVETLYNFCLCMLQIGFTKFCWNSHTIFVHDATNWV